MAGRAIGAHAPDEAAAVRKAVPLRAVRPQIVYGVCSGAVLAALTPHEPATALALLPINFIAGASAEGWRAAGAGALAQSVAAAAALLVL